MSMYEYRPRPQKDSLGECYSAGWKNPEELGSELVPSELDPGFVATRGPERAKNRTRGGEIGSYVSRIGVVVDAERVAEQPCRCMTDELQNWMFLPVENTAKLTKIE